MVNPAALAFSAAFGIDKILNVGSGSFSAPDNTGSTTIGATVLTGVNDLVFYDGTYTVDGGNPQDLGAVTGAGGVTNSLQVWAVAKANQISIIYNNHSSSTHTIGYSVAVISKPSNTIYTVEAAPNNALYFDSSKNYQKIAVDYNQSLTFSGGSSTTPVDTTLSVPHNLGYRPAVRAFIDDGVTLATVLDNESPFSVGKGTVTAKVDTDNANVNFRFTNTSVAYTVSLSARIYYDAN